MMRVFPCHDVTMMQIAHEILCLFQITYTGYVNCINVAQTLINYVYIQQYKWAPLFSNESHQNEQYLFEKHEPFKMLFNQWDEVFDGIDEKKINCWWRKKIVLFQVGVGEHSLWQNVKVADITSMVECKAAVSPVRWQWRYWSLALTWRWPQTCG